MIPVGFQSYINSPQAQSSFWPPQPEVARVPYNVYNAADDRKRMFAKLPQENGNVPLPAESRAWYPPNSRLTGLPKPREIPAPSGQTTRFGPVIMGANQYISAEDIWRAPELPTDRGSRENTIDAIVSDLPKGCSNAQVREHIRNNGLYGIKGNVSCDLLNRSSFSDQGYIQPLNARNSWLSYISEDQLHSRDQWLIPTTAAPQVFQRPIDPLHTWSNNQ